MYNIITIKMVKYKTKIQSRKFLKKNKDYFILFTTIPYKIKQYFNLQKGETILWEVNENGLIEIKKGEKTKRK